MKEIFLLRWKLTLSQIGVEPGRINALIVEVLIQQTGTLVELELNNFIIDF